MKKYCVSATYSTGAQGFVTFPDGKTWEDVEDWYVKWDTLWVQWSGGPEEYEEFSLNSDTSDSTDWKRPIDVSVYAVDADGDVDYNEEVAEA